MEQKRVSFHTLGCKLNYSESSTLAREFERGGYIRVEPSEPTDVAVINSCSVTEHADKKCRNIIRKIHRRNPNAIIAVTGCYAQLKPNDIAAIEGVDLVLSNNDKGDLFRRVEELKQRGEAEVYSCSVEDIKRFFPAYSSADRTRSFLRCRMVATTSVPTAQYTMRVARVVISRLQISLPRQRRLLRWVSARLLSRASTLATLVELRARNLSTC